MTAMARQISGTPSRRSWRADWLAEPIALAARRQRRRLNGRSTRGIAVARRHSGMIGISCRPHLRPAITPPPPCAPTAVATPARGRAALGVARAGLRFRKDTGLDLGDQPSVRPDIVFPKLRLAVFVDGCFWHGCQKHRSLPASNASFWKQKIEGTRQRDQDQVTWLREPPAGRSFGSGSTTYPSQRRTRIAGSRGRAAQYNTRR